MRLHDCDTQDREQGRPGAEAAAADRRRLEADFDAAASDQARNRIELTAALIVAQAKAAQAEAELDALNAARTALRQESATLDREPEVGVEQAIRAGAVTDRELVMLENTGIGSPWTGWRRTSAAPAIGPSSAW